MFFLQIAALQKVECADDRRQQIVEVVGYAAGQLADRFELLRLAQGLLGVPTFGDVHGLHHHRDHVVVGPVHGPEREVEGSRAARQIDGQLPPQGLALGDLGETLPHGAKEGGRPGNPP